MTNLEIKCRHCNEPIEGTTSDRNNVIGFHYADPKCYDAFCESYKEYGIRIGMRVHKEKKKK